MDAQRLDGRFMEGFVIFEAEQLEIGRRGGRERVKVDLS